MKMNLSRPVTWSRHRASHVTLWSCTPLAARHGPVAAAGLRRVDASAQVERDRFGHDAGLEPPGLRVLPAAAEQARRLDLPVGHRRRLAIDQGHAVALPLALALGLERLPLLGVGAGLASRLALLSEVRVNGAKVAQV
jgi:hypothetical protein